MRRGRADVNVSQEDQAGNKYYPALIEAERLYKVQTQSLDQAESAIQQSRARLQSSFERLAQLQDQVLQNFNAKKDRFGL